MDSVTKGEKRGERLLRVISTDFEILRGHPLPLGAMVKSRGINFSVFSRHATALTLVIFLPGEADSIAEFPFDPRYNRTGDVWHIFVRGLDPEIEYGYRARRDSGDNKHLHRYAGDLLLLDPYAREISGRPEWGRASGVLAGERPTVWRSRVVEDDFDWEHDQPLNIHLADSIIYEMHVLGFTRHPSSDVGAPGTFAGVVDKISHLKDLGVTAVELLPVSEFDETDNPRHNPLTGEPLVNFWGYHPIGFFAPKAAYAADKTKGGPVREFKEMVKALHASGIEVILDMVFNHTGEGNELGPTLCFRGLDNLTYYILDPDTGAYANYSGCGNTLNCNHPVVRDLIIDCLCYWVTEMHVDGFRFDLASILGRGQDGSVLSDPPLLERIAACPVLANTKLIAEAWDAAGLYQVGSFPNWGRWAEWNGKFRDDIRRFVRGDKGMVPALGTRLAGSSDLYQGGGRAPYHSINFVTSHDGFTLADLVAYNKKHNYANGERGADGDNGNHSWNCGAEGATDSPEVNLLRKRQMKNFAALLLLSRGVPMLLAGDEMGRSQGGNNNAYCHDGEISRLDWGLLQKNHELYRFFRLLIRFRKKHALFRARSFVENKSDQGPDILWHGFRLKKADWSRKSRALALELRGAPGSETVFLIVNGDDKGHVFELPVLGRGRQWMRFVDTGLEYPADIAEPGAEVDLGTLGYYRAGPRSVVALVAKEI